MSITITVRESVGPADAAVDERPLELPSERTSARELIRGHVYQFVQDHNAGCAARLARDAQGASPTERALNRPRQRAPGELDWRSEFDRALDAFRRRRVLLLIDDRQVRDLDEPLELTGRSVVTFLRLLPLAGG